MIGKTEENHVEMDPLCSTIFPPNPPRLPPVAHATHRPRCRRCRRRRRCCRRPCRRGIGRRPWRRSPSQGHRPSDLGRRWRWLGDQNHTNTNTHTHTHKMRTLFLSLSTLMRAFLAASMQALTLLELTTLTPGMANSFSLA